MRENLYDIDIIMYYDYECKVLRPLLCKSMPSGQDSSCMFRWLAPLTFIIADTHQIFTFSQNNKILIAG